MAEISADLTEDGPVLVWLTRLETAAYLRVDVRTVDRWADEGKFTRYKVAGIQSVRFKREELDALMVPEPGTEETVNIPSTTVLEIGGDLDPFRE